LKLSVPLIAALPAEMLKVVPVLALATLPPLATAKAPVTVNTTRPDTLTAEVESTVWSCATFTTPSVTARELPVVSAREPSIIVLEPSAIRLDDVIIPIGAERIALVPTVKPETREREKKVPMVKFTAGSTDTVHETADKLRNARLVEKSPCDAAEARIK
jgi:hypothetical protein